MVARKTFDSLTRLALALFASAGAGCAVFSSADLSPDPPPLASMEEPAAFHAEPDDEAARRALPAGGFTGVVLGDSRASLEAMLAEPEGLLVTGVVENSPADAAGIEPEDLILSVQRAGSSEVEVLRWPSEWRKLELESAPGTELQLVIDRAGLEIDTQLTVVARVRAAPRESAPRLREEQRVGVVVRAATEVEARGAGLGPGGGAVIVGLARESPWRAVGLRYGDLIVAVNGAEVAHPEVLLEAIRTAKEDATLELEVVRGSERLKLDAPVSERESDLRQIYIPLIYSYERERGESTTSAILGLYRYRSTAAAWELRLLWLFKLGGGDADRLEQVDA